METWNRAKWGNVYIRLRNEISRVSTFLTYARKKHHAQNYAVLYGFMNYARDLCHVKCYVHPQTGHKGPDGKKYNSTPSLASALDVGGWLKPTPGPFNQGKRPSSNCMGGWVGPGPVWKGTKNLTTTGLRSPDRQARSEPPYRQTTLSRPTTLCSFFNIYVNVTLPYLTEF